MKRTKRILAAIITIPVWLLPCLVILLFAGLGYFAKGIIYLMVYAIDGKGAEK